MVLYLPVIIFFLQILFEKSVICFKPTTIFTMRLASHNSDLVFERHAIHVASASFAFGNLKLELKSEHWFQFPSFFFMKIGNFARAVFGKLMKNWAFLQEEATLTVWLPSRELLQIVLNVIHGLLLAGVQIKCRPPVIHLFWSNSNIFTFRSDHNDFITKYNCNQWILSSEKPKMDKLKFKLFVRWKQKKIYHRKWIAENSSTSWYSCFMSPFA